MRLARLRDALRDESGSNALEYGLIASIVSVAIILSVLSLSGSLESIFSYVAEQVIDKV